jgi:hypothetical protein
LRGKDLRAQAPLESSNKRMIEDIPDPPEESIVTPVTQEKKYCPDCREVIAAKSDLALPKADIGLNATVLMSYLWLGLRKPLSLKAYSNINVTIPEVKKAS